MISLLYDYSIIKKVHLSPTSNSHRAEPTAPPISIMKPFFVAALVTLAVSPCVFSQSFLTNCTWQTAMLVDSYLGAYCNNDNWEIYSYDWTW